MTDCDKAKIVGYIEQTPLQIETINKLKEMEINVVECFEAMNSVSSVGKLSMDHRWLAIAKTHIQQGFMAAVRAVARPNGD